MPTRNTLVGMLPGMRMRELVARNNQLFDENKLAFEQSRQAFRELMEELRLNREERADFRDELAARHEQMRAEREEMREAMRAEREEAARKLDLHLANQRAVTRELIAEMREHHERLGRQVEAQTGALTDLAKEIRSWSSGGGAPPATA